jgi:hypothetical protein
VLLHTSRVASMQLSNVFASSSRSAMEGPAARRPARSGRKRSLLSALAVGALALAAALPGAEAKGIGGTREISELCPRVRHEKLQRQGKARFAPARWR